MVHKKYSEVFLVLIHWNSPILVCFHRSLRGRHHWCLWGRRHRPLPQQWVRGLHCAASRLLWRPRRRHQQTANETCAEAHYQTGPADPREGDFNHFSLFI